MPNGVRHIAMCLGRARYQQHTAALAGIVTRLASLAAFLDCAAEMSFKTLEDRIPDKWLMEGRDSILVAANEGSLAEAQRLKPDLQLTSLIQRASGIMLATLITRGNEQQEQQF
eukprot:1053416-Pelagomonas_calceolata.AAC.5